MIRHACCSATVVEYFGLAPVRPIRSNRVWQAAIGEPIAPAVISVGAGGALEGLIGWFSAVELLDGSCACAGRQPNKSIVLARLNTAAAARGHFLTAFCIAISFCKDRVIAAAPRNRF